MAAPLDTHPRQLQYLDKEKTSPPPWTRHPTLYMSDGSIILLAGSTLFRVYRGLLSKHSEVFRDMFSLAVHQPLNADTYDGCPLVRISDDPNDLTHFLSILHDIDYSPEDEPVLFRTVAGILRLSTKYMVPTLRRKAIAQLSRAYPKTFDRYFYNASKLRAEVFGCEKHAPHPFTLIALFRECHVYTLLPQAFLGACQKGYDALVRGDEVNGEVIRLSQEDTRVALLGWQSLREADCRALISMLGESSSLVHADMCDKESCCAFLMEDLNDIINDRRLMPFSQRLIPGETCDPCNDHWLELLRRDWANLPAYFGLPPWTCLVDGD